MTGVAQGGGSGCVHGGSGIWKPGHRLARVAVQVRQWLCLEGAGTATRGSSCGCWRLRVWEEIGMKGFCHFPPLFINHWSN